MPLSERMSGPIDKTQPAYAGGPAFRRWIGEYDGHENGVAANYPCASDRSQLIERQRGLFDGTCSQRDAA